MANKPNPNITVPKEMLGVRSAIKQADHGPFYFFSAALPIHRVTLRDSVPHVYPCTITPCTDYVQHLPQEQCERLNIVSWSEEIDQVGNRLRIGAALTPADAVKESLLEMYAPWGLTEIETFVHLSEDDIQLSAFNKLIYPVSVEPWSQLEPELEADVAKLGGLAVRKNMVKAAIEYIKTVKFENQFGKSFRTLALKAAEECLAAFTSAAAYVNSELNASDTDIRLRLANAGGKPTYDARDAYMQWLLARPAINESRAQGDQQVVIQMPEGFNANSGLNLSKEDLVALLSAVSENAAKAALAAAAVPPPAPKE